MMQQKKTLTKEGSGITTFFGVVGFLMMPIGIWTDYRIALTGIWLLGMAFVLDLGYAAKRKGGPDG